MNEEIDFILDSTKESMNGALKHLEKYSVGSGQILCWARQVPK